jgi:fatty-acyl-CoA synthase
VSFVNLDGKVGAVGRIPPYLEKRAFGNVAFVRFDVVEEAPVRDRNGFCIRTKPDEVGEAIGRVGEGLRTRFDGYNDNEASKKKILRDVFEPGDMWFRTGDLMKKDAEGYVYFVDRIGDTFRWKGENVSTGEVAECLAQVPGITTANVYGVAIPGTDGRAGMAAITTEGDVDLAGLHKALRAHLPAYAIPVFIRVQKEAATTGTFKYRKVDLVKEGFDPARVDEPLWYANPARGCYEPLTPARFKAIQKGQVRF